MREEEHALYCSQALRGVLDGPVVLALGVVGTPDVVVAGGSAGMVLPEGLESDGKILHVVLDGPVVLALVLVGIPDVAVAGGSVGMVSCVS